METDERYKRAWIVLGGKGWTVGLKSFYEKELKNWIPAIKDRIVVVPDTDTLLSTDLSLD